MISRQDRVQVWASQLAANDFPPICAVTGKPAETWRKFRFSTPPPWAYALIVLIVLGVIGLLIGAVVIAAVSMKASGHLPLTKASSRLVGLATWIPPGLIIGSFALWTLVTIGAFFGVDAGDPNAGTIGGLLLLVGVLMLIGGLVGRLVFTPLVCPRGKVTLLPGYPDKLIEIQNVHPAFVAAVTQIHQARAQQYAAMQAQSSVPPPPGSN